MSFTFLWPYFFLILSLLCLPHLWQAKLSVNWVRAVLPARAERADTRTRTRHGLHGDNPEFDHSCFFISLYFHIFIYSSLYLGISFFILHQIYLFLWHSFDSITKQLSFMFVSSVVKQMRNVHVFSAAHHKSKIFLIWQTGCCFCSVWSKQWERWKQQRNVHFL